MTDSHTPPEAFYLPLGVDADGAEEFIPTHATRSVWSEHMQHGSPPAALLVRAMENVGAREGSKLATSRLTRVVVDLLGPVAVAQTRVSARVVRPGRNVELIHAELSTRNEAGEYVLAATASAWRMSTADTEEVARTRDVPFPDQEIDPSLAFDWGLIGYTYIDAVEWRWISQANMEEPGMVWGRPRFPLVLGEETSAMVNLFNVVDAANGVGATLNQTEWTFLNTDLAVHLHREPHGDWVGLVAHSSVGSDGIGLCAAVVHDEDGPLGRSAQSLMVRSR